MRYDFVLVEGMIYFISSFPAFHLPPFPAQQLLHWWSRIKHGSNIHSNKTLLDTCQKGTHNLLYLSKGL